MTNLQTELKILQDKATKYDNFRTRYVDYSDKLNKIILSLTDLKNEISPTIKIGTGKKQNLKPIIEELIDKMNNGVYVTAHMVETAYPDVNKYTILASLRKHKHIKEVREGRHSKMYIQNDI